MQHFVFGQQRVIDSLSLAYKGAKYDTVKLYLLAQLCTLCEEPEIPNYANPALELADKLLQDNSFRNKNFVLMQKATALYNLGLMNNGISNTKIALDFYEKSLKIREQLNDKNGIASCVNDMGVLYHNKGNIPKALEYYNRSLQISIETRDRSGVAVSLGNIGNIYFSLGDLPKGLEYTLRSLKIREEIGDKKEIANALTNLGVYYNYQGNIPEALNCLDKSLKLNEEIKNKEGIAWSLTNMGVMYFNQGDDELALDYYSRSLKIREEIDDKNGVASTLHNMGAIYSKGKSIAKALEFMGRSLKIREKIGDKQGMASSLSTIGVIYFNKGDISLAMSYYLRSLRMQKECSDKKGITDVLFNIGYSYLALVSTGSTVSSNKKNMALALSYADSSLVLSREMGYPDNIFKAEKLLSRIDSARGNYEGAFEHYKQYIIYRDSINNKETRKAGIKSQLKYEYDKKEAVIKEQQDKERVVSEEKNRRQQIIIWSVGAGLLFVIAFAVFVFRSLKVTKQQKLIIEEKQKDILDSIHYAKRIQQSLLPNEKYMAKHLDSRANLK